MNSYSFLINSPIWLAVLVIVAGFGLSFWTYKRTVPPISSNKRISLMLLRGIGLSLLLFAIFEPVLSIIGGTKAQPKLVVLLDNSQSASAKDSKTDRFQQYKRALEQLALTQLGDEALITWRFDENLRRYSKPALDSLNFKGALTDIAKAIRQASYEPESENVQAAIILTDGAFNAGNNPLYDAETFAKPIFTIGIGDSSAQRDISITSVVTNEISYVGSNVPVNVNLSTGGYSSGSLRVTLSDNGNKIAEQSIAISPDKDSYSVNFTYSPKQEGIRKLTASVGAFPDELTTLNNHASEFIKVLKNKRRIVIFAGAPSSDLSFIRQNLSKEKELETKAYIQKSKAEFYENPSQAAVNESEAIILIGFPNAYTPASAIDMIAQAAERGKSILFIASKDLDYNKLKKLEPYLPFTVTSTKPQEFLAAPDVRDEAAVNQILRVKGNEGDAALWNALPPIFRTETFVKAKPESEVLATFKVNNVALKEPLLITRDFQGKKSLAVIGYGIYRWKLLGYGAEQAKGDDNAVDLFDQFITNSVKWLAVTDQNKTVSIRTTKKFYSVGERVEFIGQVYDQAYAPLDNANVNVKISGSQERSIILASLGNGRYAGSVQGLPKGDYYFTGTANYGGKNLGSESGRFAIGEQSPEFQNLQMNAKLLRDLSSQSGGKFHAASSDLSRVVDEIKNLPNFKAKGVTLRREIALWNFPWLLGAAILLFSIEWFIRKRSGLI